jgi:hypothetical protein
VLGSVTGVLVAGIWDLAPVVLVVIILITLLIGIMMITKGFKL